MEQNVREGFVSVKGELSNVTNDNFHNWRWKSSFTTENSSNISGDIYNNLDSNEKSIAFILQNVSSVQDDIVDDIALNCVANTDFNDKTKLCNKYWYQW